MARLLNAFLSFLAVQALDCIWPRITGPREKPPKFDEQYYGISPELLEAVENNVTQRMAQAENRMVAVDRKLLALFRLTSLLATLSVALLAGAAGLFPTVKDTERTVAGISIILITYAMIQLICAARATIKGLEASRYASQTKETILPLDREADHAYRRRQIRDVIYVTEQHEWATNRKVSHMQVAYRAIRNTILPLIGLMATAAVLAYVRLGL